MTEPRTLPERRAEETRHTIVQAAERVFGRKGYGEATVDDVIKEAGVSRGAFYHHFANKEEVFRGLLEQHLTAESGWKGLVSPAAPLRAVIRRFVEFQVGHLRSEHESGALSLEFWAYAGREAWAREAVASFHRSVRERVSAMLRDAQAAGTVRAEIDVERSALLILSLFEGLAVLKALDPESVDVSSLTGPWTEIIERYVSAGRDDAGRATA